MNLFVAVTVMSYFTGLGDCIQPQIQSFNYEKRQKYGLGNRVIPSYRRLLFGPRDAYPQTIPTIRNSFVRQPYSRIRQGRRVYRDSRIFKKTFTYPANNEGHRIMCDNMFDCQITFMSIDTDKGIPIILRGGVGYKHFTVVVRAKPGDPLSGNISAYCLKTRENTLPLRARKSWAFPKSYFNVTDGKSKEET